MIDMIIGFGVGLFFGIALMSCMIEAKKADEQPKEREDIQEGWLLDKDGARILPAEHNRKKILK